MTRINKEKVDKLLEEDAKLYTNLGSDSTKAEKAAVKVQSRKIYRQIKELDPEMGDALLRAFDSK